MRKTPQLREVLPIYPAMPFPPLARFAPLSAIRKVGADNALISAFERLHGREIRRRMGDRMERFCPMNGLDLSPLLRSIRIVTGRTRGTKNGGKGGTTDTKSENPKLPSRIRHERNTTSFPCLIGVSSAA